MISLHYDAKDPYRIYGIEHFIQKYGIPVSFNTESDVNIIYSKSFKGINKINIRIIENEMQNDVSGYLRIGSEKIPLLEKPIGLKNGEPLVTFANQEDENEYPCVIADGNIITIGFDIFNEVGHILSGYLEPFWKANNLKSKRLMSIPVVDCYEKILFDCLMHASKRLNTQLNYKPFWPNGKKFAVCLTHDVDRVKKTFQYATHTIRHLKKGEIGMALVQWSSLLRSENPYWNFDEIMEIERNLGVKSTFFFLNEQRKTCLFSPGVWKLYWGRYDIKDAKIVEMIKKLDAEGWEIGIHGSYNSYRDLKRLEEEKNVLEGLLGKKVHGISQHYCNLNIPETWEYHEKLGLAYDSTIGFVTDIGFRRGTCHSFHPFNPAECRTLSLWELPVIIMDNACSCGKREVWREIIDILNNVEKYNGVLLLRWHQEVFNELACPERLKIYKKIIGICKEKDAWITNADNIVKWLTTRERL